MWTYELSEPLRLSILADQHRSTSQFDSNARFNMDKSVFARVLKVIIQCVEEGSALLQTFKMEGDISNTRITIEFQSYEVHTGIPTRSDGSAGHNNDDSSHSRHADGQAKDRQFHSPGQSSGDSLGPGTGSQHGGIGGQAETANKDGRLASVVLLRDRTGQNLRQQLEQSLAELEKSHQHDTSGEARDKKLRSRQRGVNLEQVIHDQNHIPPVTETVGRSELREAIKHLDYNGKKKPRARNPFTKSRSLDELDSHETNIQATTAKVDGSLLNGTGQRQQHPGEARPTKAVTFTSPRVFDLPTNSSDVSGVYAKGESYDTDEYQGTGSSHDDTDTDSDESLESVTDIRKFNMNQRKKMLKKRKSVIAL